MRKVNIRDIKIRDDFFSRHIDLVRKEIIPYQWNAMNDRIPGAEPSHCMDNFKIAAGLMDGNFFGAVFQDTDIAKWLEAVGFSLASYPDEQLMKTADEVIDIIAKAQQSDGYLDTYFIIKEPGMRWKNLCEGHELYTAGHMMEAAVAYFEGTGKRKLLDVCIKLADLICDTFGPGENQIHGYPGHPEVEVGLIKLYKVTNDRKYLDMAKYFVDARGVGDNYFLKEMERPDYKRIFPEFADYDPKYSQSHEPVRNQNKAEGHAVRAMYLYSAMAELAFEYDDTQLLDACKRLWDNTVTKRMYITGSIGSSGILERFTTDNDLPNDCNYSETCASIGLMMFAVRMCRGLKDASYMDIAERALYNTVLSGLALDGKSFFYVNPLEMWPASCLKRTSKEHVKPIRQKWFGVACCPPNIARTLASLSDYMYFTDGNDIYVNLFISNEGKVTLDNGDYSIKVETKYPYDGLVKAEITPLEGAKGAYSLKIRIPKFAENVSMKCGYKEENNYAVIESAGEKLIIEMELGFCPHFVRANPNVRADEGKVCLVNGPLVYALEEIDNGDNLPGIYVDPDVLITREKIEEKLNCFGFTFKGKRIRKDEWKSHELYGLHSTKLEDVKLTAIPYAYWNNRGQGEMLVWMKELIH